jgi:SAM-dependent methyltransferase
MTDAGKNPDVATYTTAWDTYWKEIGTSPGAAFWDSGTDRMEQLEIPILKEYFPASLPVVDVGCGGGQRSLGLARHFTRVIGVDCSQIAIAGAEQIHTAPNLTYQTLDLLDGPAVQALHSDIGDANVYIHGVLHQLPPHSQQSAAAAVAALVGAQGSAFVVEVSSAAATHFAQLIQRYGPLPKLQAVFEHGIQPARLEENHLPSVLAEYGLRVVVHGQIALLSTQPLPDGSVVEVPFVYWLLRPGHKAG